MPLPGEESGEVGGGDGEGGDLVHVGDDDGGAAGGDGDGGDCELGDVVEVAEPDSGEAAEAGDAGEGAEVGGEIRWEAKWGDGAVEEGEGLEGGEGVECGGGEEEVVGAV